MNYYTVDGVLVAAKLMLSGVLIDPQLPAEFDDTPNETRPASDAFWWRRPFVISYRDTAAEFLKRFPDGVRYDVRCLDGGAWDRSTWWGSFGSLEEAVACAKAPSPHGDFLGRQWPGRSVVSDGAN